MGTLSGERLESLFRENADFKPEIPEILIWVSYEFSWDLWCKMDFSSYPVDTQVIYKK